MRKIWREARLPDLAYVSRWGGEGLGSHSLVDEVADDEADADAADDGEGERRCGEAETDTADEDDCLETFAENGDEGQQEHGVLFGPPLEGAALPGPPGAGAGFFRFEGSSQLDAPLVLQLGDAQEGGTHDGDDDGGDDAEGALPDVLDAVGEVVLAVAVEGADQGAADDQAEQQTGGNAIPDLAAQLLVDDGIALRAERLLQEGQQDGADDDRLEAFSEADEED